MCNKIFLKVNIYLAIIFIFMALSKPIYHIITEKLWGENSWEDKKRLFELLVLLAILQIFVIINLLLGLTGVRESICLICDAVLVLMVFLSLTCLFNNRQNCVLNTFYTVPLFVYGYYISNFTPLPLNDTIYLTVSWLIAGAFVLLYFSDSDSKR